MYLKFTRSLKFFTAPIIGSEYRPRRQSKVPSQQSKVELLMHVVFPQQPMRCVVFTKISFNIFY